MAIVFDETYDLSEFCDVAFKDKNNYYYHFYKKEDKIEYLVFNPSFHPILFGIMEEVDEIDKFFFELGIIQDIQKVSCRFVEESFKQYATEQQYL